jgi:hypothetical protein
VQELNTNDPAIHAHLQRLVMRFSAGGPTVDFALLHASTINKGNGGYGAYFSITWIFRLEDGIGSRAWCWLKVLKSAIQ